MSIFESFYSSHTALYQSSSPAIAPDLLVFLLVDCYEHGFLYCSPFCKKAKQAIFSLVPPDEVEVVEVNVIALCAWLNCKSVSEVLCCQARKELDMRFTDCCLLPILLSLHGAGGDPCCAMWSAGPAPQGR